MTIQSSVRLPSQQMRAVLKIFRADATFEKMVMPHIDLQNESIRWDKIFLLPLNSGLRSLAAAAYGVWRDEPKPRTNFFEGALNWDKHFKRAVLDALSIRWGLAEDADYGQQSTTLH